MSDHIKTDYIFFRTKNYTGNFSTSGYALSISPFTFIPDLNQSKLYSKERILWDFGDGTTSQELCASHYYKSPGVYTVSLYAYDSEGESVVDSFKTNISVENFITDTIALSSKSNYIQEAGTASEENVINVIRYNSWQSYNTLSAAGYTINLYASGSNDDFFDEETYNNTKYGHLQSFNKFYTREYNSTYQRFDLVPTESIQTSNELLYAKVSGDNLVLCDGNDEGAVFVGTYGTKQIYFVADTPSINGVWFRERDPVLIFASFDTSKFESRISIENNYPISGELSYLNSITTNTGFVITPQTDVNQLSFSSNGIDGLGSNEQPFKINSTQYAETKIPVVIKIKDSLNYPTKYIPTLTAVDSISNNYEIKIDVLSGDGELISESAKPTIVSDFSSVSSVDGGGFWKGFLYFDSTFLDSSSANTLTNIHLSANTNIYEQYNYVKDPTPLAFVGIPSAGDISRINIIQDFNFCKNDILTTRGKSDGGVILSTSDSPLSSISIQVIPESKPSVGSYYDVWVTNDKNSQLEKYDTFGTLLSTVELSSTPSQLAADSNKDIWVTLFNDISAYKISNSTGDISVTALPSSISPTASSFAIETDTNNNIWVSYNDTTTETSTLVKFDTLGVQLSTINLTAGYLIGDIAITQQDNLWITLQESTTANNLSEYNDVIAFHDDSSGITSSVYNVSGRSEYITVDVEDNAFFTKDQNTVVKLSATDYTPVVINLPELESEDPLNSDLTGIASTAGKDVIVISNSRSSLLVIDTVESTYTISYPIRYIDSYNISSTGDWTGFNWILKYSPRTTTLSGAISGVSSKFDVYRVNDRYLFGKINEDFDATNLYKDLRYQEALLDDDTFFNVFIGSIVGNVNSDPTSLGKTMYEKAANFVSNNQDIDTCEVDALYNICKLYDENINYFDNLKFGAPATIKRLVNLLSIKQSKLWGGRNKFDRDFDVNNYDPSINNYFGINLGPKLDVSTTILTAGSASEPIVAYSKFGERYTYINTNLVSSAFVDYVDENLQTYALSSYNYRWGWPLVLTDDVSGSNGLEQYYDFHSYIPSYENTQSEGVINWNDTINSLQETASAKNTWFGDNQIVENIFTYNLLRGFNIFYSTTGSS